MVDTGWIILVLLFIDGETRSMKGADGDFAFAFNLVGNRKTKSCFPQFSMDF